MTVSIEEKFIFNLECKGVLFTPADKHEVEEILQELKSYRHELIEQIKRDAPKDKYEEKEDTGYNEMSSREVNIWNNCNSLWLSLLSKIEKGE